MQTKAKSNSVITHSVSEDGTVITFHVKDAGDVVFDTTLAAASIIQQAAVHGLIQRVSDRAAIGRDPETGASASPEEKMEAMQSLVEHYESGSTEWSLVQSGGPKGGMLFKALVELYPAKTGDEIKVWLAGIDRKSQDAMRQSAAIAAKITEIKSRKKAVTTVDTDALLATLAQTQS